MPVCSGPPTLDEVIDNAPVKPWLRRSLKITAVGILAVALTLIGCVSWVRLSARSHLYSAATVPSAPVAIIFGAQVFSNGTPSPFLVARLEAGMQLYDSGKVQAILVSGDNSTSHYDEPDAMKNWLIAHGVPEIKVVADYAGFDTYDTCVRAHRIFGVSRAIVVSQPFHVPRAVTICRDEGIVADGVSAPVPRTWVYWRGAIRDQLADVKAAYDVVSSRDPVFLGKHETGIETALAAPR